MRETIAQLRGSFVAGKHALEHDFFWFKGRVLRAHTATPEILLLRSATVDHPFDIRSTGVSVAQVFSCCFYWHMSSSLAFSPTMSSLKPRQHARPVNGTAGFGLCITCTCCTHQDFVCLSKLSEGASVRMTIPSNIRMEGFCFLPERCLYFHWSCA